MTHRESSYYPQRADVFSPLRDRWDAGGRLLRRLVWKNPAEVDCQGLLASALIPGAGIYLRRRDPSGLSAVAVCALLGLIFFIFLGYRAGNIAFTLLLTIHLIGFVGYCKPLLAGMDWFIRLVAGVVLSVTIIGGVYLPLQSLLETHFFMPLQSHGHVVVVQCSISPRAVKRGEWLAFRVKNGYSRFRNSSAHGSVIIKEGVNLAPVLAVAGDHVEFSAKTFSINGVAQASRPHMLTSGDLTVPPGGFFVWPELSKYGGGVPEENVAAAYMEVALVSSDQFVGKPLKHWFGRRQIFS